MIDTPGTIPEPEKTPLVSVAMAVRNEEQWVAESIRSILGQTFTDFELIITDDASTDRTADILRSWAARDSRIRLVSNARQQGLARSLNRMIDMAKGRWIARMDGDDRARADRLEKQAAFLAAHPDFGMVGSFCREIDAHGRVRSLWARPTGDRELKGALLRRNPFIHSSILIRRSVVLAVGGYDPARRYAQDYDLWLRVAQRYPVANIPEPLIDLRVDWSRLAAKNRTARRYEYTILRDHLRNNRRLFFHRIHLLRPLALWLLPSWVMMPLKKIQRKLREASPENGPASSAGPGKKPLRVLQVIARLNIGGPAIIAVSLASELPPDRFRTRLVCGRVSAGEGDMGFLAWEKNIAPLYFDSLGRELSPFRDFRSFFAIFRTLMRENPDIVHTHTAKAGALGRCAVLLFNSFRTAFNLFKRLGKFTGLNLSRHRPVKTVHTFHGHVFDGYFSPTTNRIFIYIERILAFFTDRIIVLSNLQKRDITEKFRICPARKAVVLPLGLDLSPYLLQKDRGGFRKRLLPDAPEDAFVVGIVGRLTAIKNHALLLNALRRMKEDRRLSKVFVLVVGDGELKAELSERAETLGIAENVVFAGWRKQMPQVYAGLDAVALTSRNEGTPAAVIEAMASGRPVVATAVGGVPDLLGSVLETDPSGFSIAERGLLVPPDDPKALAAALSFLQADAPLVAQTVRRAQSYALDTFSTQRMIRDTASLYDSLI